MNIKRYHVIGQLTPGDANGDFLVILTKIFNHLNVNWWEADVPSNVVGYQNFLCLFR